MKQLLTLTLLLLAVLCQAQTANYTATSADRYQRTPNTETIVFSLYDTLSGANDTLLISFNTEQSHWAQACLSATWLATGTTSSSSVVLQGRNTTHETWTTFSTATYAAEVTTATDNDPIPFAFIRIMAVSAANIAHLRISLAIKKI